MPSSQFSANVRISSIYLKAANPQINTNFHEKFENLFKSWNFVNETEEVIYTLQTTLTINNN
jgi:hypothetical protein